MMELYFISGNKNKLGFVKSVLGENVNHIEMDLNEIQGVDGDEVVRHKVKEAYSRIEKPVFVMDTALYINCLNGFPGPLVKWFWTTLTLKKVCLICNFLGDRKAYARTTLAYYDGSEVKLFHGTFEGQVSSEPRGEGGFGWDSVFIPTGSNKTFAQMNPDDPLYARAMHEAALERFKEYLGGK